MSVPELAVKDASRPDMLADDVDTVILMSTLLISFNSPGVGANAVALLAL